jgi:hypothetical protein
VNPNPWGDGCLVISIFKSGPVIDAVQYQGNGFWSGHLDQPICFHKSKRRCFGKKIKNNQRVFDQVTRSTHRVSHVFNYFNFFMNPTWFQSWVSSRPVRLGFKTIQYLSNLLFLLTMTRCHIIKVVIFLKKYDKTKK